MSPLETREITTLSGVALGGIVGGILASPLGPWVAVGGSTVGATVGGWVTTKIWQEFYADLREKMELVKLLLEKERFAEAVDLICEVRAHPRYEAQEENFRSELETALGRITTYLARKAEDERDYPRALDYYRRARQIRPHDASILARIIHLKTELVDLSYETSGQMAVDIEDLLALDPHDATAYRSLVELHDRQGDAPRATTVLRRAVEAFRDRDRDRASFLEALHRREPDDASVTLDLLTTRLEQGDVGGAAALVHDEVERGEPLAREPAWLAARGELYLAKGEPDQAEPLLHEALEAKGVLPRANLTLGRVLILRKQWAEAAAALAPLVSMPRYGRDVLVPLTESLIKAGRLEEAELHLERSVFHELPDYPATLKLLAEAYENKNRQEQARRVWNLLGDVKAGPPFWQRYAIVYRNSVPVLLGSGRMGRVYLGRRRDDDQMVAIREIPLAGMHDTLRMKRFRREVELRAGLDHPNIARLHGHALLEGKCLMAVEYCRGGNLADRMGRRRLLWSETKSIAIGLLECLAYLHEHTPPLVHRNLKPSNILLDEHDAPKIADFALARLLENATTSVITSVHEQAVSYRYLAPEVILGSADVGPAADLYSMGCILYEMVTGSPPFVDPDIDVLIRAQLKTQPKPPSAQAPWVPAALDDLVLALLEKSPERRSRATAETCEVVEGI